jgi:two-component system cell cycle sensor histidine kinase/response regulator CckA
MSGEIALIGGALELTVPSYALRLVRRFGAHRVGWFVVIAFASLAMLHLVGPWKSVGSSAISRAMPDAIYGFASVLLLIGMGHLDTLFTERERARGNENSLLSRWQSLLKEKNAELVRANEQLVAQIARLEENEKALKASEAQYHSLFTDNPQPMWIIDVKSTRFLAANNAALRQYGFKAEEFMALTVRDLLPDLSVSRFWEYVAKTSPGQRSSEPLRHYRKDGTPMEVAMTAADIRYAGAPAKLVLAEDVTQRRRRELASHQAQRMEIIGRVAGGVAHHFNNILTVIQGYTSILLNKVPEAKSAEQLNRISAAVNRAAALTQQLLAAGRRHTVPVEPLDLNGLVRKQSRTLQRLVGENILLENTFGNFVAPMLADRRLVEYILINLVLNARDATPAGGTITISTANLRLDDTQVQGNHEARAGEFVRLSVRDTGCGMTPDVQARLFEPFFTTKDIGKASGLGLAGVYGAVKQLSGWIEFTSDPGVGTEFRVFLPSAPMADVLARMEAKAATRVNKGTILLVEPDDRARGLARCVLNWNDYRVIEADGSTTASLLWDGQAANIDLLLTDLGLPDGMSGPELAQQFQQTKPGLKVIYSTVSRPEEETQKPAIPAGFKFIPKPFTPEKLVQVVQSCLTRGA